MQKGQETPILERRNFLKRSMLGGVAAAVISSSSVYGMGNAEPLADECQGVSAADLLALFSSLAWRLPNKLKAADEARDVENKIYKDFNTLYQELVDLAKQLKIRCDAVTQKDPRLQEIFELTNAGQNKVRYMQTASSQEKDIAYLQLATLAVAARQVGRSANEILPGSMAVDNKLICQMLEKINEMQKVKGDLDVARKTSNDLFKGFRDSIGSLNKSILDASESAAKAERGEIGNQAALKNIDDAERILIVLTNQSSPVERDTISPEQLKQMLAIPKAMLRKEIPGTYTSERHQNNGVEFRTAAYALTDPAADSDYTRIANILASNIRPSGWWTVSLLATACLSVLKLYKDEAARKPLIRNALQSVPWIETAASNFPRATAAIASMRV